MASKGTHLEYPNLKPGFLAGWEHLPLIVKQAEQENSCDSAIETGLTPHNKQAVRCIPSPAVATGLLPPDFSSRQSPAFPVRLCFYSQTPMFSTAVCFRVWLLTPPRSHSQTNLEILLLDSVSVSEQDRLDREDTLPSLYPVLLSGNLSACLLEPQQLQVGITLFIPHKCIHPYW